MVILVPIRTVPGLNAREHWRVGAKRKKLEREAVAWVLRNQAHPPIPCSVRLTRIVPSGPGCDDDNLAGSMKSVRDEIALWLGVDDRHSKQVRYVYDQKRGPWGVTIEWGAPVEGAQFELIDVLGIPAAPEAARARISP